MTSHFTLTPDSAWSPGWLFEEVPNPYKLICNGWPVPRALVITQGPSGSRYTDASLLDDRGFSVLASATARRILKRLSESEAYPLQIAHELQLHPQRIYYHIRRMREAGIIRVCGERMVRGARAHLYRATAGALVYSLTARWECYGHPAPPPDILARFFRGFYQSDQFKGLIVVGSPEEHGPLKIKARDGHYSAQLSMFLGRFWRPPDDFVVKLDVDVKAEKAEGQNLILLGGPGANIITAGVNSTLPIRFREDNYWLGLEGMGRRYTGDNVGLLARVPNPYAPGASVIVLAGIRSIGTKAAVLALTRDWERALATYEGQESWSRVVQGFDFDGDGKIDGVEYLE